MSGAYYNDTDKYVCAWLRNLIAAGLIAPGDVDERSIKDVMPDDVRGYTQCHFFAGVAGWSIALRLAGWDDARPVWSGSCPCQPFSAAGSGKAANDERHLWPAWFSLIRELRPPVCFGEQVEAAIGWGWLDAVFADLEGEGYSCASAVLPACGVGAPHIRQRLWFVANAQRTERRAFNSPCRYEGWDSLSPRQESSSRTRSNLEDGSMADSESGGFREQRNETQRANKRGFPDAHGSHEASHWADAEFIPCTDGKARPTQPGIFPLAHGIQRRASKLRAYGNAIVPQVAAEFIAAFLDCESALQPGRAAA